MKVNIVMLVHHRARLTMQALNSLYQNTPESVYNLTVVEDGISTPYLDDNVARYAVHLYKSAGREIIWANIQPQVNITGRLRNAAVYLSEKHFGRGDWLCLCDNDLYFTPGWLPKMLAITSRFVETDTGVLGGWNHPYLQPKTDVPQRVVSQDSYVHTHDAVTGAHQLMRWETWDEYGPLDAHAHGVGQSEDWAFCQKLVKAGNYAMSVYPRVVLNCGITNSYGQASTGADVMVKELEAAKVLYTDLYWE